MLTIPKPCQAFGDGNCFKNSTTDLIDALQSIEHGCQVRIIHHPRLPRRHRPAHPMFHHHSYHSQSCRHCHTLLLSRRCRSCIDLCK